MRYVIGAEATAVLGTISSQREINLSESRKKRAVASLPIFIFPRSCLSAALLLSILLHHSPLFASCSAPLFCISTTFGPKLRVWLAILQRKAAAGLGSRFNHKFRPAGANS